MNVLATTRDQDIVNGFRDALYLARGNNPVAAHEQRGIAIGAAREAGICDYHEDVHVPPQVFRPYPELLDSWLFGNGAEAIAAACHELLAYKRQRDNETFADVEAMVGAKSAKN